jgi:hippurate hydrolase
MRTTLLLLAAFVFSPAHAWAEKPADWARANADQLVKLYEHFHQTPELSFQEEQTALRLGEELRKAGAEVTQNVGGFGVVGVLAHGEGPTVMLRTDLDALPVVEQTGVDYASKVKVKNDRGVTVGVMHACGHDIHITNLIGVARYLAANKDLWRGTVVFIGQPAEERGAGAKAMLADGLFQRFPRPDYALALHVDSALETGKVGVRTGYALANVDSVDITIRGKGGHGAYPHTTIDPVVIAAKLIVDLQTIISREVMPVEPAVITVGSVHAGTKHNIISDDCTLQITVRSYSDKVRSQLIEGIRRKTLAAAASANAPAPEIKVSEGTPALFNNEALGKRMAGVFRSVLGEDRVVDAEQSMGGEDFSRYGRAGVPILMYRLGSVRADRLAKYAQAGEQPPSLHSALFYPDAKEALETSVATMASGVLELLKPTNN